MHNGTFVESGDPILHQIRHRRLSFMTCQSYHDCAVDLEPRQHEFAVDHDDRLVNRYGSWIRSNKDESFIIIIIMQIFPGEFSPPSLLIRHLLFGPALMLYFDLWSRRTWRLAKPYDRTVSFVAAIGGHPCYLARRAKKYFCSILTFINSVKDDDSESVRA